MATYSNILAWEIPWTEEPGELQSMGSQRVGHDLVTKQQQQDGLSNRNLFSYGSRALKSKIAVSAGLVSLKSPCLLAICMKHRYMGFSLCLVFYMCLPPSWYLCIYKFHFLIRT